MKKVIQTRISALRDFLFKHNLSAFIIPSADPHLSEYTASHWKSREWISGFNGSAGTVAVTQEKAGLWTDSRYFLQGAQQIEGTGIDLYKEGLPETPSLIDWLCTNLPKGSTVGIDGKMFAVTEVEAMLKAFEPYEIQLNTSLDPMEEIWEDRPAIPEGEAYIYDLKYAGESSTSKIARIKEELHKNHAQGLLVSALDEVAWTLNLRGNDVKCNPFVVSYLLITDDETTFFINPEKVTEEVRKYLESERIIIKDYTAIESRLSVCNINSILLSPEKTNYAAYSAINSEVQIIRAASPIALLKAVKNEEELKGVREAMIRDGVALVKFLRWLEDAVPSGKETEMSVDKKLHEFRAQQDMYVGESFDTIAGYGEHGAIVHYSATPETNLTLQPKSFLLLDSGAQYLDATTDITRTIPLGELTEEEKTDYTLVLKGHIAIAMCKFPYGTRGAQIDVLARLALWKSGMNYLHGTGHGVGHFLSVHEGPQSIRLNENPTLLLLGMITSNEPGVYKGGKHGVRIENLTIVQKDQQTEFGDFYKFETVTLCPIDKQAIVKDLLSEEEIAWLNEYHQMVYDKLSSRLDEEERKWLADKTSAI